MGTDFLDGLIKTISNTTKELGKTTKELSARAEQTIEAQKIRTKIAGEERTIEKLKMDIGNIIYKKHADGEGIDSELSVICQEIDQHYLKIREFKDSVANIKGQKLCPSCEREVDITVSFCPYCGTPCPTPEPAKDVEGEPIQPEDVDTENVPQEEAAQGSCEPEEKEAGEPKAESTESEPEVEQKLEEETVEEDW